MAGKKWLSQFNICRRNKHSRQGKPAEKTDLTEVSRTELQSQHAHCMPATSHKPAMTPSGDDTVRKDSVQKQSTTPFEPKLLWDRAYDSLRGGHPGLVEAYERVLSCELSGTPTASASKNQQNIIEQKDKEARRSQMRQLIDKGLAKTELEAKVKQDAGHVVDFVLASNHMISTALKGCPEAALAWTGVTFALQMIANPIKETETNRAGVDYVARKMDWYWTLSKHLLKDRDLESKDYAGLQSELEVQIIHLYKVLLSYQMKSVCSYYRNRGFVFLKDLVQLHDWEGQINDVREAVTAVLESSHEYSTQQILDIQEQGTNTLRDIHYTLQKQTLMQRDSQEQAKKDQEEEKDRECLKDLRLTNPEDDMKRIQDSKDPLLHESFVWILSHPCFIEWADDKMTQLLWIKGDPGKGKTMLLIGIINDLSSSPHKARPLSFFLCQATDANLNNATAVLRGLIYQILVQQRYLISHLRKEYDTAGSKLFEGGNAFPSMSRIFNNMLQDPRLNQLYLVVDALDECQSGLEQLLNLINETSAHTCCQVVWLVSSRNRPDIEERLRPGKGRIELDLEKNAENQVFDAVSTYVDHKTSELAKLKQYDSQLQADVRGYLHMNSYGTYLWVALVCKQLEKTTRWKTRKVLKSFPPGLQPLYQQMIEQIHVQCDSDDLLMCMQVLGASTLAYRPIHLTELTSISHLPNEFHSDQNALEELIGLCGSFLIVRNGAIYFVHQSAKDYLLESASTELFPHERAEAHRMIVSRSLESMAHFLRRDIYTLQYPGICIADVHPPLEDPLASIQYACLYWVDHLLEMGSSHIGMLLHDNESVDDFLKKHLLHWLEALSLMRSMSNGVSAIAKLLSLVKCVPQESSLSRLVQDAHRFVLFNRGIIEDNPLQVYYSALIFSPVGSLTRHFFKKEEPHWITTKPVMEPKWGSCLQTLEGHSDRVKSVAFSSNGARIASGSHDYTVKIWDASNGACLQTLEGHSDWVNSMAFSPDGACVASGSDDKTGKIWDVRKGNGVCLQTLEGHSGWVKSVTFSPDGACIASGSDDYTVKIWNVRNGACLQTLEGHSGWVKSVAFSSNGARIASGSHDYTVKIWDVSNEACLQTLEGHSGWVNSVAFSPDGVCIASGSDDKTVRIWDVSNGVCLQTFEGHSDCINSVAFSSDGAYIASGSCDKAVKIWDVRKGNGACLQTLEGHSDWVNSVAFSPDGACIASGSDDKAVKIWDASSRDCLQALGGHISYVRSVVLSSDGACIASGSHDKSVKVWDVSNGACLQTLEGHSDWVNSVAFSPDGTCIASGSDDKTVKIWDVSNGTCLQTLEGHGDCINSVVFSSDGARIASGSHDKTVKIWDVSNGTCLQTLEGHSDCINSVIFSSDGARIASGSHDYTVKIWDVSNGACLQTLEGHSGWVNSVAFSSDDACIASGSHDYTVKIWNVRNGACLQTFEGQGYPVTFDATTSHFRTEMGILLWNGTSRTQKNTNICGMPQYQTYALNANQTWITWNGQNILWLPSEYRPSSLAIISSTMVIGCRSGLVLIFDFSNKAPLKL